MEEGTKKWWQSRGVVGPIASVVCLVLAGLGYELDANAITVALLAIGSAAGDIVGAIGRARATKRIAR